MGRKRNMPSKKKIVEYWSNKYDNLDENTCFKCGYHGYVERAHINSVFGGGSDDVDNIHLLCSNCHRDSEPWENKLYDIWFDFDGTREEFGIFLFTCYANNAVEVPENLSVIFDNEIENIIYNHGYCEYEKLINPLKAGYAS